MSDVNDPVWIAKGLGRPEKGVPITAARWGKDFSTFRTAVLVPRAMDVKAVCALDNWTSSIRAIHRYTLTRACVWTAFGWLRGYLLHSSAFVRIGLALCQIWQGSKLCPFVCGCGGIQVRNLAHIHVADVWICEDQVVGIVSLILALIDICIVNVAVLKS